MIIESHFKPAWWLRNRHMQTIWQKIERRKLKCPTSTQRLELPDGDFLDLHWTELPKADENRNIVLVLHGLEGSINSTYARGMLNAIRDKGDLGVLLHFRSCGGIANRLPRAYHSGETSDLSYIANYLHTQYPNSALFAIGFSLGGNVLCKYAGEQGSYNPFKASVAICPPLNLSASCQYIMKGTSKIYQKYLLDMMMDNIARKMQRVDISQYLKIDAHSFRNIKTLWQFDDLITAPLHGFKDAEDYYRRSAGMQFLKDVERPLLILQAKDDPFLCDSCIPTTNDLSHKVTVEVSNKGGHVGYVGGNKLFKGNYWMEQRALQFIHNHVY
ncbi:alpha/beta-hydrolase [Catenovulum agarivorans DS-2]|uniref:Alpha/beta-hydrolase n=1 Tax=Catenovulum agarivorans DS-2 TaxID=1328313 RepID=W7QSX9_9ALTE|nr:hydrolase [Catenovulum agarivorans]EWH10993.1 alpha/beta-hydrolase [Catenovulum agarivorans DS-2]